MKKGIITLGIVALLVGITLTFKKEEKELYNITDNENNTLAFFIEEEGNYKGVDTLPTSGYTLNEKKSFCSNGAQPTWSDNSLEIMSLNSSNTNCYLYFDEVCGSACKTILAGITPKESPDGFTGVATTDEGVFKAQDDDGETYYWRGAVTNNYVNFANKFWRIIRINGDGTIRMIYDGDTPRENGTTFNAETSAFNTSYNDNMYVGFKYTSGEVHGTGTESDILKTLNTWYTNNLKDYADKIDINAGFCNDREPSTSNTTFNGEGGTGTTRTYYGVTVRMGDESGWAKTQIPTFECNNSSDLFTKNGSKKGNGTLINPIGLITADEVIYAGGFVVKSNQSYYLYTGQGYWTLSPYYYYDGSTMFIVYEDGLLGGRPVLAQHGIRPVINLKADAKFTYDSESTKGTMDDPYVVVGGN